MNKIIGKVIATQKNPSTCDYFFFWTDQFLILNPFDVVKVDHVGNSATYGVIEEMSHITDQDSFLSGYVSSDFGDVAAKTNTMQIGLNYIKVKVVSNTKNVYIPVTSGSPVALAQETEVLQALGLNNIKEPIVAGFLQMYSGEDKITLPVHFDSRFLIGPEGAHLNISGISGLATKTSYAMFLLKAIQDKYLQKENAPALSFLNGQSENTSSASPFFSNEESDNGDSVAFVLFNVKGRDLFALDEECDYKSLEGQENLKAEYQTLGLTAEPLKNVHYYLPYGGGEGKLSNTYLSKAEFESKVACNKVQFYKYACQDDLKKIDMLFSDIDDPNETIESIVSYIANSSDFDGLSTWEDFLDKVAEHCEKGSGNNKDISVLSWRKFNRIIKKAIQNNKIFAEVSDKEPLETRLEDALKKIKKNEVYVIDISKLDSNMQSFVFGDVIKALYEIKLGVDEEVKPPKKIIIFVDELNKYASKDTPKSSPILRQVLDIAERGRSLGLILFAAEQFRSAIHDRVKGNCSTAAYGRTNDIEISNADYRSIPPVYKNMMTKLGQGEYIICNPMFRSPLNIKFPYPIYKQS